jgi:hypothetical protein
MSRIFCLIIAYAAWYCFAPRGLQASIRIWSAIASASIFNRSFLVSGRFSRSAWPFTHGYLMLMSRHHSFSRYLIVTIMLKSLSIRRNTLGVRSHLLASTTAKLSQMSVTPLMCIIPDRANVSRNPSPAAIPPNYEW